MINSIIQKIKFKNIFLNYLITNKILINKIITLLKLKNAYLIFSIIYLSNNKLITKIFYSLNNFIDYFKYNHITYFKYEIFCVSHYFKNNNQLITLSFSKNDYDILTLYLNNLKLKQNDIKIINKCFKQTSLNEYCTDYMKLKKSFNVFVYIIINYLI